MPIDKRTFVCYLCFVFNLILTDMNAERDRIEKMVRFDDRKKNIVRTDASMQRAIDERIGRIKGAQQVMNGMDDYDDSITEF